MLLLLITWELREWSRSSAHPKVVGSIFTSYGLLVKLSLGKRLNPKLLWMAVISVYECVCEWVNADLFSKAPLVEKD